MSPIRDASRATIGVTTVARDISERKALLRSHQEARAEASAAQQRMVFLGDVSAALVESLDYETTLASVARLAVPQIADWCTVDVVDDEGTLRRLAVAHVDPAKVELAREWGERYPPEADAEHGPMAVLRSGRPEMVTDITDEMLVQAAPDDEHLRLMRELHLRSVIFVPLVARGRALGVITLVMAESGRTYGATDLALAEEMARRAAIAVDNARLYRDAQRALQIRDQFLSVASHELRTPITVLQLQVQILDRLARRDEGGSLPARRVADTLNVVERQIKRLSKLSNDLLDVSRITQGEVRIERSEVDLSELVQEVMERFDDQIERQGGEVTLRAPAGVTGFWDRTRIDQVVTNLLSNAIVYGEGKPIAVSVERDGARARLVIRDRGIGIAPENLQHVFERFGRGVSSQHYGGLGLGLYIVRRVVDAHGGTIGVESEPGVGSTFTVELPIQETPDRTQGTADRTREAPDRA
jgi:signal transduction histidine kinase